MGSYLSIQNDTSDVWYAKIGPDEAAINISGTVATVVGLVAAAVATAGAAAPLAASLQANGVISLVGVSTANIASVSAAAASLAGVTSTCAAAGTVTGMMVSLSKVVQGELEKQGMVRIEPGGKHRWGKMTLSLWQQGTCVRTRVNPHNAKELLVETLYMRPIFSGQTDDSENVHRIQWWIAKWGVSTQTLACPTA
ncbi:hypothetical protein PLESTB_000225100 [Pleodorina starrii]|uniref:Uncharacterized protein n=1 Tax=Pleodorina starrii TaxID=330485 RepID=A0A9W6BD10_9CHLO|nr:hypothetical protein PLESTM_002055100 [Pleodorina starrii]GLC49493.1 hypothetical protein PLESTB_000225100 [Pleodorina starrii]GLC70406.1 hypothetical protein PLESTF_000970000 [Pleodorina starrii]